MRRLPVWVAPAVLALCGGLSVTLTLHRTAVHALERVLEERLRGAGESAARLTAGAPLDAGRLMTLMQANQLEAAYLVDERLAVVESAGGAGATLALLRLDVARVRRALAGAPSVEFSYALGQVEVAAGYFPREGPGGQRQALVLEAGETFSRSVGAVARAGWLGAGLSLAVACGLAFLGRGWARAEADRRDAAERAARGTAIARMAAIAAHEIRNPLSVIRGTVDLMRERSAAALGPRDRQALEDILGEVERLRRLTGDLLALASERPLTRTSLDLAPVVRDAARALSTTFPQVQLKERVAEPLWVEGDAQRLRQVLANLLTNAAQARPDGAIALQAWEEDGRVRVQVADQGPGIPPERRDQLFEPFVSDKQDGTGLGLALSKKLVEQHRGSLRLVPSPAGATFEIALPRAPRSGRMGDDGDGPGR